MTILFIVLIASVFLLAALAALAVYGHRHRERWVVGTAALIATPLALMLCFAVYFVMLLVSWPDGW